MGGGGGGGGYFIARLNYGSCVGNLVICQTVQIVQLHYSLLWPLQWPHNERDLVSNHRRLDCLLSRLIRHKSKKTSKLHVTSLCEGNPPVTGGFPSQRASNAETVSSSWSRKERWTDGNLMQNEHRIHGMKGTFQEICPWFAFCRVLLCLSTGLIILVP